MCLAATHLLRDNLRTFHLPLADLRDIRKPIIRSVYLVSDDPEQNHLPSHGRPTHLAILLQVDNVVVLPTICMRWSDWTSVSRDMLTWRQDDDNEQIALIEKPQYIRPTFDPPLETSCLLSTFIKFRDYRADHPPIVVAKIATIAVITALLTLCLLFVITLAAISPFLLFWMSD